MNVFEKFTNLDLKYWKLFFFIFLGFLFSIHLKNIKPEYTFAIDSFVKLVQTVSLKESSFKSEELFYAAKELYPSGEFFALQSFSIKNKERFISPFSASFAILNALTLSFLSWKFLPFLCLFTAFISLFFLNQIKKLQLITFILASLCTSLLFQGLEYSENPLLLSFEAISLVFFFKGNTHLNRFFTGFFLAIGCFLRLEPVLFIALFILSLLMVSYRGKIIAFFKNEIYLILGILAPLSVFCVFNFSLYSHILGPRFLINQSSLQSFIFSDKFLQVWNLLLLAKLKIGFFGFTPLFLWVLVYFFFPKRRKMLRDEEKILFYTVIIFLPMMSIIAPNDGVTNWGARYKS